MPLLWRKEALNPLSEHDACGLICAVYEYRVSDRRLHQIRREKVRDEDTLGWCPVA